MLLLEKQIQKTGYSNFLKHSGILGELLIVLSLEERVLIVKVILNVVHSKRLCLFTASWSWDSQAGVLVRTDKLLDTPEILVHILIVKA